MEIGFVVAKMQKEREKHTASDAADYTIKYVYGLLNS